MGMLCGAYTRELPREDASELENIIGISGDVRILRVCDSKVCNRATRLFNRIGKSQDNAYWIYNCERCDGKYISPINPQDKIKHQAVRLRT